MYIIIVMKIQKNHYIKRCVQGFDWQCIYIFLFVLRACVCYCLPLWVCLCWKREEGNKTPQSSVKCQKQQTEGGWWFTERRSRLLLTLCGLLWDLLHATERNVDIFTSRQQLKGDQLLVTHSKHTAFTWLWRWKLCSCQYRRRNSETLLQPFSTFRHESENRLYIRSLFCSQEFDLRLVHESFPVLFAVCMQWMVL